MIAAARLPVSDTRVSPLTAEHADALALDFRDLSWRQAPAYAARAARDVGARVEYVSILRADRAIGFASVRLKPIPLTGCGLAFVSQGPAVSPAGELNFEHLGFAIDALVDEYVIGRRLVLRIQPPLYRGEEGTALARFFEQRGFSPGDDGRYRTMAIRLDRPLDEIRRGLDAKWRSDLKRAEASDLEIVRSDDPADFDRFAPIFEALTQGKGFSAPQGIQFFREVASASGAADHIRVHLAIRENRVVAGHIGSFSGDTAVYLLGAANQEGRETRAAYLLQWAVLSHARELGQHVYDLGGIDELRNPDVFRFKKRMGGYLIETAPAYQRAPGRMSGLIVQAAGTGHAMLRRYMPGKRR